MIWNRYMELRKCADRNTETCCCNSYYIETLGNNQEVNKISPSPMHSSFLRTKKQPRPSAGSCANCIHFYGRNLL